MVSEYLCQASKLDPARETPAACREIVSRIGYLAPWLLTPECCRKALEAWPHATETELKQYIEEQIKAPRLWPDPPGSCYPILAISADSAPKTGALRRAFFLPLQWKRDTRGHSPRLPKALHDVATQVVNDMGMNNGEWALDLHPRLRNRADIRCAGHWTWRSAWAPLTAGLRLAAIGGRIDNTIAASGAWDAARGGVVEVDLIEYKAKVAKEYGCKTFFVSVYQDTGDDLRRLAGLYGREFFRFFPVNSATGGALTAQEALAEYHHRQQLPPDRESSLELRCEYANGFVGRQLREKRERYVATKITPDLAAQLRAKLKNSDVRIKQLGIFSSSPSAALLSMLVFQPESVTVFCTEGTRGNFGELLKYVDDLRNCGEYDGPNPVRQDIQEFDGRVDTREVRDKVTAFFRADSGHPAETAIDVTGGNSGMKAAAAIVAAEHEARVFYLDSRPQPGDYLHQVGTEEIRFVR